MEIKLDRQYSSPSKRQRILRIAEFLSTGGLSVEARFPSNDELTSIEDQGFCLNSIQTYLNRLDQGLPEDIRTAAMLRGAFNDLLSRLNEARSEY